MNDLNEPTQAPEREMTQEEVDAQINSLLGTAPLPEEKQNVHTFLHSVAIAEDTTKVGNLTEEEIGLPKLPLRTYKELAVFCEEVLGKKTFAEYFRKKGEILTATSLSKEAKLLNLAVTTTRQVTAIPSEKPRKENRGWFKPKRKVF